MIPLVTLRSCYMLWEMTFCCHWKVMLGLLRVREQRLFLVQTQEALSQRLTEGQDHFRHTIFFYLYKFSEAKSLGVDCRSAHQMPRLLWGPNVLME